MKNTLITACIVVLLGVILIQLMDAGGIKGKNSEYTENLQEHSDEQELTDEQIKAISELLKEFEVSEKAILRVENALRGE